MSCFFISAAVQLACAITTSIYAFLSVSCTSSISDIRIFIVVCINGGTKILEIFYSGGLPFHLIRQVLKNVPIFALRFLVFVYVLGDFPAMFLISAYFNNHDVL